MRIDGWNAAAKRCSIASRRWLPVLLAGVSQTTASLPVHAADKPPIVLAPSSQWVVDYDDDSCIIARAFGPDAQRMIARLTWFEPSDDFQLTLIGRQLPDNSMSNSISVRFVPRSEGHTYRSINGISGDLPMMLIRGVRLDAAQGNTRLPVAAEWEGAVKALEVGVNGRSWRLALGPMGKVMAARRTCMRDLVKHWGYDPAVQDTLFRPATPTGSPGNWITIDDYPSDARTDGVNGLIRYRLDIDRNGGVAGCHILKNVRFPELEKSTCNHIRARARFRPALDAAKQPVASYYVNAVRWRSVGA